MAGRDIVVVGASAGGIEALSALFARLPGDLPASILVVQHIGSKSILPTILSRVGPLPAVHPTHDQPIAPGRIYVAPPGLHMKLGDGVIELEAGPHEHSVRPAADVLMRTAARWYGSRVIGVVLSGMLHDGTLGLLAIAKSGGLTVAQDPQEASCPEMPRSAIERGAVRHVLPIAEIAKLIIRSSREPAEKRTTAHEGDKASLSDPRADGEASPFSCPECGGVLWQRDAGGVLQFRCRVGHAYIDESLMEQQSERLEEALWAAIRSLEEHAHMSRRLARRATEGGMSLSSARFDKRAMEADRQADLIRQALAERARNAAPGESES